MSSDLLSKSLDDIIKERVQHERKPRPAPAAHNRNNGNGPVRREGGAAQRAQQVQQGQRSSAPARLGTKKLFIGTFTKDGV